jgi:hypothetical protein
MLENVNLHWRTGPNFPVHLYLELLKRPFYWGQMNHPFSQKQAILMELASIRNV